MYDDNQKLHGAEVVIDKDFASALLAKELNADMYIMAIDGDAVYLNWGTDHASPLGNVNYDTIKDEHFAEGSMKPKVAAACWFTQMTGKIAAIGSLNDLVHVASKKAGTIFHPTADKVDEVFGIPLQN